MNIFADFEQHVVSILEQLAATGQIPPGLDYSRLVVEPPRDISHGDLSTNAAMVLAKDAKMPPRQLAELIAAELKKNPDIEKVDIAGPGFINMTLVNQVLHRVMHAIMDNSRDFARGISKEDISPINVEYVSANPTGPMHVGHARGAVFGDTLANLLTFAGFKVTKEYYINDAGAQVDVLARSAFYRYKEALGENIGEIPAGLYPGDYLKPVGHVLAQEFGKTLQEKSEDQWLPIVREKTIDMMMNMIRDDLSALNIHHDLFFSERSLSQGKTDEIANTIEDLKNRGMIYEGRLPPPKGQPVEDWEDREQTLFRATEFGDDIDRPLLKSDGSYTYFAADIAYHRSKYLRGFKTMVDVWGADHGGYIKRMQAAVKAVSHNEASLDVRICQLVRLLRNGVQVKMSKRKGEFVTLREVVDEVGVDATRFMMLYRKNDAPLDFDLAKVIERSIENPVYYVQYAHARFAGLLYRRFPDQFPDLCAQNTEVIQQLVKEADFSLLTDASEKELLLKIASFPRLVEAAAKSYEPHRIAFFLFDLAGSFHSYYQKGNSNPELRIINQNARELTLARLALVFCLKTVFSTGLEILGVSSPDEM